MITIHSQFLLVGNNSKLKTTIFEGFKYLIITVFASIDQNNDILYDSNPQY